MNNEPVAWISENDLINICHKHPSVSRDKILDDDIPLYSEGFVRQQQAEIDGRQNSMNALFGALTEKIAENEALKAKLADWEKWNQESRLV